MQATDSTFADLAANFLAYQGLLHEESERGSAIVAAAVLDDALTELLLARLLPAIERTDELLEGPNAPLSSFSAKIDLAYRLDLIKFEVRSTLHIIRRMRNEFAHRSTAALFDQQARSRVREILKLNRDILSAIWADIPGIDERLRSDAESVLAGEDPGDAFVDLLGWRRSFELIASITGAALLWRATATRPIQSLAPTEVQATR